MQVYALPTHPYEKIRVALQRAMRDAYSPMTSAEQSNSMWKPSDMSPRLFVHTPYSSSTPVNACIIDETRPVTFM